MIGAYGEVLSVFLLSRRRGRGRDGSKTCPFGRIIDLCLGSIDVNLAAGRFFMRSLERG